MSQGRRDVRARDERNYRAVMEILVKIFAWAFGLLVLMMLLLALDATGGHDGWLCVWGYDSDGAGDVTSDCG
jgi:hypothetical protein